MPRLQVDTFKKTLAEEIKEICDEKGWTGMNAQERGGAFQIWCAQILCQDNQNLDTDLEEVEDAILYKKDLGADIVLKSTEKKLLIIVQCKYVNFKKTIDEEQVNSFFGRHKFYMDRNWIEKHGSKDAIDLLLEYSDLVKEGYAIHYYFISTGKGDKDRLLNIDSRFNETYSKNNELVPRQINYCALDV